MGFSDVPDFKNSNVTLIMFMTTLLGNLTLMDLPSIGHDCLPPSIETTQATDLARIKHYRNYLAHLNDGNIELSFFNTACDDLTSVCMLISMFLSLILGIPGGTNSN